MNVRPCALIVEDEPVVALDLEDAMKEMGFYVCGVAASQLKKLVPTERPFLFSEEFTGDVAAFFQACADH